jgi:hypothetical protein
MWLTDYLSELAQAHEAESLRSQGRLQQPIFLMTAISHIFSFKKNLKQMNFCTQNEWEEDPLTCPTLTLCCWQVGPTRRGTHTSVTERQGHCRVGTSEDLCPNECRTGAAWPLPTESLITGCYLALCNIYCFPNASYFEWRVTILHFSSSFSSIFLLLYRCVGHYFPFYSFPFPSRMSYIFICCFEYWLSHK